MMVPDRREDIGKYRIVENGDTLTTSKPRALGCAIGCVALIALPLIAFALLFFTSILGKATQQVGFLAASLIVFSLALILYGFFFGFGRNKILEISRKSGEIKHKGRSLGLLSNLEAIVIESRQIEVKVGKKTVVRDQVVILLDPIGEKLPVAFFTKYEIADRMARLLSQFTNAPIRSQDGPPQQFFGAGEGDD